MYIVSVKIQPSKNKMLNFADPKKKIDIYIWTCPL